MKIAIHDSEKSKSKSKVKFPNLALMKIANYNKNNGDTVHWWCENEQYDRVYSSKIFTFTEENPNLPADTIKGGTGYEITAKLTKEIDDFPPDYSIYPDIDYAIGYCTRGCIRNCEWCVVPQSEGNIKPYRTWQEIVRADTEKIVLMDNNILASDFGINQLQNLIGKPYKININQGIDCRLITSEIAEILSRLKYIKYIRFACDNFSMIKPLSKAIELLKKCGVSESKIFMDFLVGDISDAILRVTELRKFPKIHLYGQAYRDFRNGGKPISKEELDFAQRYIFPQSWIKKDWYETPIAKKYTGEK